MRTVTSGMQTEFTAAQIRPFYMAEIQLISGYMRLWSGNVDLSWSSLTWSGNGWFRGLSSIRETGSVESTGIEITLSGVPSTVMSAVLGDMRQGATLKFYLGMFNGSGAIIADPLLLWEGKFDRGVINDSASESSVRLSYESQMAMLKRSRDLRYTDAMQQLLFPGDKGFQYVNSVTEWRGFWGKKNEPKRTKRSRRTKK